jgi:hypothetical protein
LDVELAPRIAERVRLCFAARGGFALPKPQIEFAGRSVATWGRPLALLSAGVSLEF